MRRQIFLLLFVIIAAALHAAEPSFILRGSVVRNDSSGRAPLDSVMISLSSLSDTAAVGFKMLEGNNEEKMNAAGGNFRAMVYAPPGKYMLTLEREGYDPVMKEIERKYKDQTTVWVGSITMTRERHKELNEVEVVQTAIKVVMKGDTIVYNADAFNLAEGSMLNALVRQLPGAELTADGRIKVNGRFVSSLLLNGKDFFTEDPSVALENLPAYAVKNVKVYDKAGEDDYLTKASQKLDRNEEEENLVMDVVLKKQYATSWMASLEAGYGTSNRWRGKAFGLGFTEKFRLTAFVNANNIMDYSEANTDGEWRDSWYSNGDMLTEMGGLDYLYDDSKRWKINGNAVFSHEDVDRANEVLSTDYYSTGNLYSRSDYREKYLCNHFRTNHTLNYKGDNVFLGIVPGFDIYSNSERSTTRDALFNQMPPERSRNEALDSVFKYDPSEKYNEMLISRLRTMSLDTEQNATASLRSSLEVRTPQMRGSVSIGMSGKYTSIKERLRMFNIQHFGGANTSDGTPMNDDRYKIRPRKIYNVNPYVRYSQKWTRLNEVHSDCLNFNVTMDYDHSYDDDVYEVFSRDLIPGAPLPPLNAGQPEDAIKLISSCRNMANRDSRFVGHVGLTLSREPVVPSDSGFNPSYSIMFALDEQYQYKTLNYANLDGTTQYLTQHRNFLLPTVNLSLRSSNKNRNMSFWMRYGLQQSAPSLARFIKVPDSDNPLMIREESPRDLKDTRWHNLRFNFTRFGRGKYKEQTMAYISYSYYTNKDAASVVFNPETGVSRIRNVNVRGDNSLYGWIDQSINLGSRGQFSPGIELSFSHYGNSSYYVASTDPLATPHLNSSKWSNVSLRASLGYVFKNGSNIRLRGGSEWNRSRTYSGDEINRVSSESYEISFYATVELPWQMQFVTDADVQFNRGFETVAANKTQYYWNASLSKSLLKGDLTFKLSAYDILNSRFHFDSYSSAQSYSESWSKNTLPRYFLLSVSYRFRSLAKKPAN